MDHYFTDNRHLAENRKEISFRFWCFNVSFITDNGVFSKDSVDFGTRVLLNTLHEHEEELGNQLLDMGCGYGVVGIVTKKAWPDKQVEMVDVNPRAVELARDNAEKIILRQTFMYPMYMSRKLGILLLISLTKSSDSCR